MAKKIQSYESAIQELEQIVSNMQEGKTNMDDLTKQISRAADLMKHCKTKLRETETVIDEVLDKMKP